MSSLIDHICLCIWAINGNVSPSFYTALSLL